MGLPRRGHSRAQSAERDHGHQKFVIPPTIARATVTRQHEEDSRPTASRNDRQSRTVYAARTDIEPRPASRVCDEGQK